MYINRINPHHNNTKTPVLVKCSFIWNTTSHAIDAHTLCILCLLMFTWKNIATFIKLDISVKRKSAVCFCYILFQVYLTDIKQLIPLPPLAYFRFCHPQGAYHFRPHHVAIEAQMIQVSKERFNVASRVWLRICLEASCDLNWCWVGYVMSYLLIAPLV